MATQSTQQAADLVATARGLRPLLEAEASTTEAARTASPTAVAALRNAGMFGLIVPRELGGHGANLGTFTDVLAELAYADGSLGWTVLANATTIAFAGAWLDEAAVKEIFRVEVPAAAGQFMPKSSMVAVDGGWEVEGSHNFASGSAHASWIGLGGLETIDGQPMTRSDGRPRTRGAFLPRDRIVFRDDWHVMGLAGTGSYDYEVKRQVVGDEYTFELMAPPKRGGDMFRLRFGVIGTAGHAGWALGAGRRALDEALRAADRPLLRGTDAVRTMEGYLTELGRLDVRLRSARAYVLDVFSRAEEHIADRDSPSPEVAAETPVAITNATRAAVEVVRGAFEWSGVAAIRRGVLERCFRDIHVAAQHISQTRLGFAALTRIHLATGKEQA